MSWGIEGWKERVGYTAVWQNGYEGRPCSDRRSDSVQENRKRVTVIAEGGYTVDRIVDRLNVVSRQKAKEIDASEAV